jgi:hypothetical protein
MANSDPGYKGRQAHTTPFLQCQGVMPGNSKHLLEKSRGQAIGNTQVIQVFRRPLIQFEE